MIEMQYKITLCVLIAIISGCGFHVESKQYTSFIESYYSKFQNGEFDYIADLCHNEMISITPKDKYVKMLLNINDRFGKIKSHRILSWKINKSRNGVYFTGVYEVIYEKGESTETFILKKIAGKIYICGFNINSDVFLK